MTDKLTPGQQALGELAQTLLDVSGYQPRDGDDIEFYKSDDDEPCWVYMGQGLHWTRLGAIPRDTFLWLEEQRRLERN